MLMERDPEIAMAQTLAEDFGHLIRARDYAAFAPWLTRARESGLRVSLWPKMHQSLTRLRI